MKRKAIDASRRFGKLIYHALGPTGQMVIDRWRYRSGLLPRVDPARDPQMAQRLFARPARAALVISADLELAWGWHHVGGVQDRLGTALAKAAQARRNFGQLLALFDRYDIPVTWAVVGHLFLEECRRTNGAAHAEMRRIPYFENEYWRYLSGDWFDADPCSRWQCDPAWYAPDLIRKILQAKARHEIACHSFSHVAFTDGICPSYVADSELAASLRAARRWGLELSSFVFPGNLADNLGRLEAHGFTAYRHHGRYHLGIPSQGSRDLWRIPGGLNMEKPVKWPVEAWIKTLKRCLDRALETGTVLHLWFHPSCNPVNVQAVFPAFLNYATTCRDDLWPVTMGAMADRASRTIRSRSVQLPELPI